MSGQAAACTREEVRAEIRKVECNNSNAKGGSTPSLSSMKTTNKR